MGLVTARASDKSGTVIPAGTGARVRLEWYDGEKVALKADLTDAEAAKLIKDYGLAEVDPRTSRRGERRIRLKQS